MTQAIELVSRPGAVPFRRLGEGRRKLLIGLTTAAIVLVLWHLIGISHIAPGDTIPTPWAVLTQGVADWPMLARAASQTGTAALLGWGVASLIALVLAIVSVALPWTEAGMSRVALAVYTLPVIALAPLVDLIASGLGAAVIMGAILAFFPIFVATAIGLRTTPALWGEVVQGAGGSKWAVLRFVRLGVVPPSFMAGAYAAAPAAVAGVIIAEYMGGEGGLGIALLTAQQQLDVTRTWAVGLTTGLVSLCGPFLLWGIARLLRIDMSAYGALDTSSQAGSSSNGLRRSLKAVWSLISSLLVVLVLWALAVIVLPLSPLVAKGPVDVMVLLASEPAVRADLAGALGVTTVHTLVGLVVGLIVASGVAMLLALLPAARSSIMPLASVFRSFPVVALTPLIIIVFGRGPLGVIAIGTFIVFFPALVILAKALDRVPANGVDLIRGAGGGRWATLVKVQIPTLVPELFAAAKIAVPLAVTGALVTEWLATGDGLGRYMVAQSNLFRYTEVWAAIAVSSALAMILYGVVAVAQGIISAKYRPGSAQ